MTKTINKSILKRGSIDNYNDLLIKEYKKHNITEFVIFESEKLKNKVYFGRKRQRLPSEENGCNIW